MDLSVLWVSTSFQAEETMVFPYDINRAIVNYEEVFSTAARYGDGAWSNREYIRQLHFEDYIVLQAYPNNEYWLHQSLADEKDKYLAMLLDPDCRAIEAYNEEVDMYEQYLRYVDDMQESYSIEPNQPEYYDQDEEDFYNPDQPGDYTS